MLFITMMVLYSYLFEILIQDESNLVEFQTHFYSRHPKTIHPTSLTDSLKSTFITKPHNI